MNRWPMAGRIEEQAYLAKVIADPDQAGVLVAGPAGVGKTRLIREAVEAATDAHVELVTATESARALPFGASAHLLPEDLGTIDRVDLLAVIGRHLVRRAQGKPAVLAVDDMHLLDEATAAWVHHIATSRLATVVLTLRSGESAPDAVTAFTARYRPPIGAAADFPGRIRDLVEGALDGPTERITLDRMWAVTDGNVLFARELIGDALDARTLALDHGVWCWTGGLSVAPRPHETVAARLGDLRSEEREFLELLSLGEPLTSQGADRLASQVSVSDLERRGLLTVERAGHRTLIRLAHPLFGETLRATMPESVHRQINHDLAEDLARADDQQPGDKLRLALLHEAAGEPSDPGLLADAARNANQLADHQLAERLARASVLGGDRFSAGLELGRALLGQGRFEETEAVLAPLIGNEPSDTDRETLADVFSQAVGYGLGRVDEGLGVLAAVEQASPTLASRHSCSAIGPLCLLLPPVLMRRPNSGEAPWRRLTTTLSVLDRSLRSGSVWSWPATLMTPWHSARGPSSRPFASRTESARAPAWAVMSRCTALFFDGRAEQSLEFLDLALGTLSNVPMSIMAQSSAYRGRCLLSLGRVRTANRFLNDAAVTFRHNPGVYSSWCLGLVAEARALLGHHEEARAAAAEAVILRRPELLGYQADDLRALAWVDAQDGHISSAVDQLWEAANLAASWGQRSFEIIILHDLLRLGERQVANRIRQLTEHVDGAWSAAIAAHAEAIVSNETADLETAAEAFVTIGSLLVAAELWATASAARQHEGLPARAAEATRYSSELAERCNGARTESLGLAVARVPLSRRERETANLAASGATNTQIAEELSVSVRTIESHLYAAFAKLGITDRNQLSHALEQE